MSTFNKITGLIPTGKTSNITGEEALNVACPPPSKENLDLALKEYNEASNEVARVQGIISKAKALHLKESQLCFKNSDGLTKRYKDKGILFEDEKPNIPYSLQHQFLSTLSSTATIIGIYNCREFLKGLIKQWELYLAEVVKLVPLRKVEYLEAKKFYEDAVVKNQTCRTSESGSIVDINLTDPEYLKAKADAEVKKKKQTMVFIGVILAMIIIGGVGALSLEN